MLNKLTQKTVVILTAAVLVASCSTKKNTSMTRWYHSVNTHYNIYFNAHESYKESLKSKNTSYKDNLSTILPVYPYNPELDENKKEGGSFNIAIDKCTKAIKLHSMQAKPEKDPDKRNDAKYQQWFKQREFNPFLKNAWMLMAKAEHQNEDYLKAAATFAYITHLYENDNDVILEAQLWIALSYTQIGWLYEADDMLLKVKKAGGVPKHLKSEFSSIYANYLVRSKEYADAIPYVKDAIKNERDGSQKIRLKYLLGQLYAKTGDKENAYKAFDAVHGMRTVYEYSLYATIRQSELYNTKNKKKVVSSLNKMAKNPKNKEYLDLVYYALGNIHINDNDTVNAIENYKKAIEKSTRNGYDKALAELKLGEIYFEQKKFIKAQPCYTGALAGIGKQHEKYPIVSLRSEVLDELVVHAQVKYLQDSLQHLASLPESERLAVIEKHIKNLREEERKLKQEQETMSKDLTEETGMPQNLAVISPDASAFYFYNSQSVEKGKINFKRLWGTRVLEDNWRLKDKKSNIFEEQITDAPSKDSIPTDGSDKVGELEASKPSEKTDDKYSVEYYLEQIPLTPAAIVQSDKLIEDALFNMGKIYKDKLEDSPLAVETFESDLTRFPKTPNKEEIYYQLLLIYLKDGDKEQAEVYRQKLLSEFASNTYAKSIKDSNYEWNMRNMIFTQDSLYEKTYNAYLDSKVNTVRENYNYMKEKYPLAKLMPKFMLLNSLTYAQTNDPSMFKKELESLVDKDPESDVGIYAAGLLKNLAAGRSLASNNSPTKGMIWDIKFMGDETAGSDSVSFVNAKDSAHAILLIYDLAVVGKNKLLYDVASYNFTVYTRRMFDLNFNTGGNVNFLQVTGFRTYADVKDYINKAFEKSSLFSQIDGSVIIVPISMSNMLALNKGKSLNEYFDYFKANYSADMKKLIDYWNNQIKEQIKKAEQTAAAEKQKAETQTTVSDTVQTNTSESAIKVDIPKKEPETTKPIVSEKPKTEEKADEVSLADPFTDEQVEKIDGVINTAVDIFNNPVDGLKNIFNKNKNKPKLTKEEKEQLKKEKEANKKIKTVRKRGQKSEQDSIKNILKAEKKAVENAQKAEKESLQKIEQDKKDKERADKKAKEDAVKQKEADRKAKAKAREELLKQKERERNEKLKLREKERKEKLKK